jgi:serpin B
MKTQTLWICTFLFFLLAGCKKSEAPGDHTINLTKSQKVIVNSSNTFGLNLFRTIVKTADQPQNTFISPLSVSLALSMTYNGAANATRDSIQKTLGYAGLSSQEVNQSCLDLINSLKGLDSKVIMEIANSIWYDQRLTVKQDFLDMNKTYFDAEVAKANFLDAGTLDLINGWVNDKTHGKIPTILDVIPPDAVMYLINAIYFKGTWKYEFDKTKTAKQDFTLRDGSKLSTDFMVQKGSFSYLKNDLFSAIELPYGDGNFSMMVMVPETGKTEKDILENLNDNNWKTWNDQLENATNVQVTLPKFKLTYKNQLNSILSSMGMSVAFDKDHADFSNIDGYKDLYISKVLHKTFVEVNEEGTEAAAVTSVEIGVTSVGPGNEVIYFRADKPFVLAIKEKNTSAIMFMGMLENPLSE